MYSLPLSDDAWHRVSPLFDEEHPCRGRRRRDSREVLNAILWVVTRGEKWHHLPHGSPPSQTCYSKWLLWKRSGVMSQVLNELGLECESATALPAAKATTEAHWFDV